MFKLQDVQSTETWGPGDEWHLEGVLKDVPFAPFSKGDKLGRAADWTADPKTGAILVLEQGATTETIAVSPTNKGLFFFFF